MTVNDIETMTPEQILKQGQSIQSKDIQILREANALLTNETAPVCFYPFRYLSDRRVFIAVVYICAYLMLNICVIVSYITVIDVGRLQNKH